MRIFALQETTYVNEWLGMLSGRITALYFRENKKLMSIKSYHSFPEDHVKKLYLPLKLRGKTVTTVGPLDHMIYTIACFLLLPLILLHDAIIFFVPGFFPTSIVPVLKLFRKKIYVVSLDPQDALYETYQKRKSLWLYWNISRFLEKLTMRSATKIFAVSNYLREQYLKYNKNISVTPNGADVENIDSIPKKRMFREFTIAYFGSIDSWRGIDMLVDAFRKVKQKSNKKIKLLLLGGGPEEDKIRAIAGRDIYMSGYIDHNTAISYCKGADLLMAPFRETPVLRKTFSIKPFEYIACGAPVVITNTGDHARLIGELEAGIVTEPSADSIADAIEKLLKDKKLYKRLKENCERNKGKVDFRSTRRAFAHEINGQDSC